MKNHLYHGMSFLATLLAALLPASQLAAETKAIAGEQVAREFVEKKADGSTASMHYWLYLPKSATAGAKEKHPLLLFLHGSGERGTKLEAVKKHGPPSMIGRNADLDSCIVVSPQCPEGRWWDVEILKSLCDEIVKTQQVDPQRIYVTGLSMGGFGTWELLARYPDFWAAAVPICGGGKVDTVEKFKQVPIWVFHGAKDPAVKLKASEEMVEALKAAGGKPKFTVYPDEAHQCWVPAYNDKELWTWLLAQKKPAAK
jgi:predicted peptidase